MSADEARDAETDAHAHAHADVDAEGEIARLEALRDRQAATLSPTDPQLPATWHALALAYRDAGRLDEAITLLVRTLKLRRRIFGFNHLDCLDTVNDLSALCYAAGRARNGYTWAAVNLRRCARVLGDEHPYTVTARGLAAVGRLKSGRPRKAAALLERNLEIQGRTLGADHAETLATAVALAAAYSLRDWPGAVALLEPSLEAMHRTLGERHPNTLRAAGSLANAYAETGRPGEAVALLERTLELQRDLRGANHRETLLTAGNLAMAYVTDRRDAEGLALLRETVAACRAHLSPGDPLTRRLSGLLAVPLPRR